MAGVVVISRALFFAPAQDSAHSHQIEAIRDETQQAYGEDSSDHNAVVAVFACEQRELADTAPRGELLRCHQQNEGNGQRDADAGKDLR